MGLAFLLARARGFGAVCFVFHYFRIMLGVWEMDVGNSGFFLGRHVAVSFGCHRFNDMFHSYTGYQSNLINIKYIYDRLFVVSEMYDCCYYSHEKLSKPQKIKC